MELIDKMLNIGNKNQMEGKVFLKPEVKINDNPDVKYLEDIKSQLKNPDNIRQVEDQIYNTKVGAKGENDVRYKLKFSSVPMYVLSDIYFKHEDIGAQIDFLLITPDKIYQVECKNFSGNIKITKDSKFILTKKDGDEVIESPIEQAYNHKQVIKAVITNANNKLITRKNFEEKYETIVVMTNKACLVDRDEAPEHIKNTIKTIEEFQSSIQITSKKLMTQKEMKLIADIFKENDGTCPKNYLKKFDRMLENEKKSTPQVKPTIPVKTTPPPQAKPTVPAKTAPPPQAKPTVPAKTTPPPQAKPTVPAKTATPPQAKPTVPAKTATPLQAKPSTENKVVYCEKCGSLMEEKTNSKTGEKFPGCSNFGICKQLEPIRPTCKECNLPMIVKSKKTVNDKIHKFYSCQKYPNCKCTEKFVYPKK